MASKKKKQNSHRNQQTNNPSPIWRTEIGTEIPIYDLETTHLKNIYNNASDNFRVSAAMRQLVKEELKAREGEEFRNPKNLTIEEIKNERRARRLILGLPDIIEVEFALAKLPTPIESLFK